jgi:putative sterol carrier protein
MAEFQSKEELYATLSKFVEALGADETFKQRIARADMTISFIVTDLDAAYTLKLNKGEVVGSEGDEPSALGAIMSSATLDRLLSGKLDGESAYEMGSIRLRGSEWVAQSAAGYVYPMSRIYKQVTGQN